MQTYELNVLGHHHAVVSISYRRLLKIGLILLLFLSQILQRRQTYCCVREGAGAAHNMNNNQNGETNPLFEHFRSGIAKSDVRCS